MQIADSEYKTESSEKAQPKGNLLKAHPSDASPIGESCRLQGQRAEGPTSELMKRTIY